MNGARWTEEDLKRHTQKQSIKNIEQQKVTVKKNKFNAKKVVIDGVEWASTKEGNRYLELKNMQQAGLIKNLRHQVEFELIVEDELICRYIADFTYSLLKISFIEEVVEDVKSKATRTPEYLIKKKLMKAIHGIEIKEV